MYTFVLGFRKFDQAARTRLGAAMYILAPGHQAVNGGASRGSLPCRQPRALLVREATVTQASVRGKYPQLCQGVPLPLEPTSPVPMSGSLDLGACPRTAGHRVDKSHLAPQAALSSGNRLKLQAAVTAA